MGRLIEYRSAVVSAIKQEFPGLRHVAPTPGVFNAKAIERLTVNLPAALVAILQSKALKRDNEGFIIGPALSAVYCVANDPYKSQVWGPAIDLMEQVADFIELNQFGLDYAGAARVKDFDVLYSTDLDDMGVCVAALTFTQELKLGRSRHVEDEKTFPLPQFSEVEDWPDNLGL
jgi:hypothetical protein